MEYYLRFLEAMLLSRADYPRVTHPFAAMFFVGQVPEGTCPFKKHRSTCMPNPRRQRSL